MFLEPEPKRSKHGHVMSTLPPPRPATAAHRQPAKGHVRRKPLQERSKSQNNQQTPTKPTDKLSLQLIKDSPRPASSAIVGGLHGHEPNIVEPQTKVHWESSRRRKVVSAASVSVSSEEPLVAVAFAEVLFSEVRSFCHIPHGVDLCRISSAAEDR